MNVNPVPSPSAARPEPGPAPAFGAAAEPSLAPGAGPLLVTLAIDDPEVIAALEALPEGRRRDEFARSALRIGVLALAAARGRIDADVVRSEGDRLLSQLAQALGDHQKALSSQVQGTLREYFDPQSGRFSERVERLVKKDGELEALLRRQVGVADSELTRTLESHLGEESPLLRMLSPDASKGVLATLQDVLRRELEDQRARILGQFSLDNGDGALARLVKQLDARHGQLEQGLKDRLDEVVGEFSLDDQDSALSRLVAQVDSAQRRISTELSLDQEGSGLARIRTELLGVLSEQGKASQKFQEEVKAALASMQARRAEAERSTQHGNEFEAQVGEFLERECVKSNDILEATGTTTGLIKNSKVGDFVIVLGADAIARGSRICVEAKQKSKMDLKAALDEMETGRKNRDCEVGLFAWSRRLAPEGLPPLARHGSDIVVIWDAEDSRTDAFLQAGVSLARALCTRAAVERERQAADLETMERAIRAIEKQASSLDEIATSAGTIKNGAEKILERVRKAQDDLTRQVGALDATLLDLKSGSKD